MDYFVSMSFYCAYESIVAMKNDTDMVAMEANTAGNKNGVIQRILTAIGKVIEKIRKMINTFIRQFKLATGRVISKPHFSNYRFNYRDDNDESSNDYIENNSYNAKKVITEMREITQQYGHIAAYLDKTLETTMQRFRDYDDRHSAEYSAQMSNDEIYRLSKRASELSQLMIRIDKVFSAKYENDIKGINAHLNSIANHVNSIADKCNQYQSIVADHPRDVSQTRIKEFNELATSINIFSANFAKFLSICQSALR